MRFQTDCEMSREQCALSTSIRKLSIASTLYDVIIDTNSVYTGAAMVIL